MALLGAASGAHCLGMCGGIVTAFALPKALVRKEELWKRQFAFNLGRVSTYAGAGALAGAAGLAWGALPCGLLYGALAASAFAGTPWGGAAAMLAFGAGTAPWLLAARL